MTLLYEEIKERLKQLDEITLLEVLDISSEDLVERFQDFIEEKMDELAIELEDDETQE